MRLLYVALLCFLYVKEIAEILTVYHLYVSKTILCNLLYKERSTYQLHVHVARDSMIYY